jgi:uncharacterized delta-60 repeat protein
LNRKLFEGFHLPNPHDWMKDIIFMKTLSLVRTIFLAGSLLQLSTLCFHSHGAAGDVDLSFDPGSGVNGTVNAVALQPDGKMIIGGEFTTVKGLARTSVARLNADGSGDSSFNSGSSHLYNVVRAVVLQPDGKVLVGHDRGIDRLNSDGSLDTNFQATVGISEVDYYFEAAVFAVAVQADGRVIIGGGFNTVNGAPANGGIARLNYDGSLDNSFSAPPFGGYGYYPLIYSVAVQPDGKVLTGGVFFNGTTLGIARLNSDGSLDNSFEAGAGANSDVYSVVVQADGKVLLGGYFTAMDGTNRNRIARLNADGSLDSSFNPGAGANQGVLAIAVQPDGKVLLGGYFNAIDGTNRNGVARLDASGSLDTSFIPGTGAMWGSLATLQPDGKVLAGRVVRLHADGSLDDSFLAGGGLEIHGPSLVSLPDGKALVGQPSSCFVNGANQYGNVRLHADGSRDVTYIPKFLGADTAVPGTHYSRNLCAAVQPDGKVLIGGYTYTEMLDGEPGGYYPIYGHFLYRFHPNGSRDLGFDPAIGGLSYYVILAIRTLAVQPDGKILVGGDFSSIKGTNRNRIARLNADGSLDGSFNPGTGANGSVFAVALQPDGKALLGGAFASVNGTNRNRMARLNADGSLDGSFNPGTGANGSVHAVALQPDGKALIGGDFTTINGTSRNHIARLNADGSLDGSFNPGTGADGVVRSIALQSDGNALIGGDFLTVNGVLRPYVARLYGDAGAPFLHIAGTNAFVIVSWPVTTLNFQLQVNSDLSLANSWSPVLQPTVTNAGMISVTVPMTVDQKFFRLQSP